MFRIIRFKEELSNHLIEFAETLKFIASKKDLLLFDPIDLEEKFEKICFAWSRFKEGEIQKAEKILKEIKW